MGDVPLATVREARTPAVVSFLITRGSPDRPLQPLSPAPCMAVFGSGAPEEVTEFSGHAWGPLMGSVPS